MYWANTCHSTGIDMNFHRDFTNKGRPPQWYLLEIGPYCTVVVGVYDSTYWYTFVAFGRSPGSGLRKSILQENPTWRFSFYGYPPIHFISDFLGFSWDFPWFFCPSSLRSPGSKGQFPAMLCIWPWPASSPQAGSGRRRPGSQVEAGAATILELQQRKWCPL